MYTGTWTDEETEYADALIEEFRDGNIPELEDGTTMRGYLADRLECAVKRISKKFEGTSYNGRKQYRSGSVVLLPEDAQKRQSNLQEMRTTFKESRSALLQTKKSKTLVKSKGATKSRAAKSKKGAAKPTFTPGVGSVGLRDTPHTNAAPQSLLTSSKSEQAS